MRLRCLRAAVTALLLAAGGSVTVGAESPLVEAIKAADRAAVRTLLGKHADVNIPEADGTTALYWAAERNDLEIAEPDSCRANAGPRPARGKTNDQARLNGTRPSSPCVKGRRRSKNGKSEWTVLILRRARYRAGRQDAPRPWSRSKLEGSVPRAVRPYVGCE